MAIERRAWSSEGIETNSFNAVFVLGSALAFFIKHWLQQLSLRAVSRHRFIASLWIASLSISLPREKFGLSCHCAADVLHYRYEIIHGNYPRRRQA